MIYRIHDIQKINYMVNLETNSFQDLFNKIVYSLKTHQIYVNKLCKQMYCCHMYRQNSTCVMKLTHLNIS